MFLDFIYSCFLHFEFKLSTQYVLSLWWNKNIERRNIETQNNPPIWSRKNKLVIIDIIDTCISCRTLSHNYAIGLQSFMFNYAFAFSSNNRKSVVRNIKLTMIYRSVSAALQQNKFTCNYWYYEYTHSIQSFAQWCAIGVQLCLVMHFVFQQSKSHKISWRPVVCFH